MQSTLDNIKKFSWNYRDIFAISLVYAIFAIGGSVYQGAIPILATQNFGFTPFQAGLLMTMTGVIYILWDWPSGMLSDAFGSRNTSFLALVCATLSGVIALTTKSLGLFVLSVILFAMAWDMISISTSSYILRMANKDTSGKLFGIQGSLVVLGGVIGALGVGHVYIGGMKYAGLAFVITSILAAVALLFVHPEKHEAWVPEKREFLWTKGMRAMQDFSPVSWVSALNGFVGYTFGSAIWLVIPLSLSKLSNSLIPEGLALGIFQMSGIFTILVGGYLADHFLRKGLFLKLALLSALGILVMGVTTNLFLFLLIAFLATAVRDASSPVLNAMLTDSNKGNHDEGTMNGFSGIFTDLGFIVGPLLGGLVFEKLGLNAVFIFMGALMLLNYLISKILLRNFKPIRTPLN